MRCDASGIGIDRERSTLRCIGRSETLRPPVGAEKHHPHMTRSQSFRQADATKFLEVADAHWLTSLGSSAKPANGVRRKPDGALSSDLRSPPEAIRSNVGGPRHAAAVV